VQLTDALARQIGKVPFHGFRFSGERFDCGSKIGFLQANIAFAMSRDDLAEPLASWIKNRMALS
jgi:UTP--glucose-1-phosphate uridylyltransferase